MGIFESVFNNPDGSRGVLGGPHKEFSKMEGKSNSLHINKVAYVQTVIECREYWKVENEIPLLGTKECYSMSDVDVLVCCSEPLNVLNDIQIDGMSGMKGDLTECNIDECNVEANVVRKPRCVRQFDEN